VVKMQMPPEVTAQVKREAELEAEKQRVFKAWDSIANTAFGLMATRKESCPVDVGGIQRSVDQIADLLRLKLEIVRTFSELGLPASVVTNSTHNGQRSAEQGGGGS
jgi:hypothetical protein